MSFYLFLWVRTRRWSTPRCLVAFPFFVLEHKAVHPNPDMVPLYSSGHSRAPEDYIAWSHGNLNVDNVFFFRDADGKLDLGVLDWGGRDAVLEVLSKCASSGARGGGLVTVAAGCGLGARGWAGGGGGGRPYHSKGGGGVGGLGTGTHIYIIYIYIYICTYTYIYIYMCICTSANVDALTITTYAVINYTYDIHIYVSIHI